MTNWKSEWKNLLWIVAAFLLLFWLPVGWERFSGGVMEAMHLAKWYAREHVLLCLVPAFFIAGAIGVFISQASVMKYLGARANKVLAYGVASVSGSVLAVCSCTVLPLFAGIWRMGAGLGPATAFLYSGPAINVLAIILTARILGPELGIARAVGAIGFSVVIGLIMHFVYRKEEQDKADGQVGMPEPEVTRPLWKNAVFFVVMVGILVFANWGTPNEFDFVTTDGQHFRGEIVQAPFDANEAGATYTIRVEDPEPGQMRELQIEAARLARRTPVGGVWSAIWQHKWLITSVFGAGFALVLIFWLGVAWWKVVLAAIPPAVLALGLPMHEPLWVLLPFSAAVVGLSVVLETSKGEGEEWLGATWTFTKQILPLLFFGVLIAGFLLGRPGHPGIIPNEYVRALVGYEPTTMLELTGWGGGAFESIAWAVWPIWTNFFASVFGAFMYFATLTEVPILQGLIGDGVSGMAKGPALALLLAGPALSLPNMLVIRSIMGTQKTIVFCSLVVVMATISGLIFGAFF
jgi:uncharacterized membrane protein YraQ (UPF0718 family)